jgi:hypothetical protein
VRCVSKQQQCGSSAPPRALRASRAPASRRKQRSRAATRAGASAARASAAQASATTVGMCCAVRARAALFSATAPCTRLHRRPRATQVVQQRRGGAAAARSSRPGCRQRSAVPDAACVRSFALSGGRERVTAALPPPPPLRFHSHRRTYGKHTPG